MSFLLSPITAPLQMGSGLMGGFLGGGGGGNPLSGLLGGGGGGNPLSDLFGNGLLTMLAPLIILFIGVELFFKLIDGA